MTSEFGVNPIGFLLQNSFLVGVLAPDVRRVGFVVDLGMAEGQRRTNASRGRREAQVL